ncbi:MAG: hypothetical protein IJV56_03425 [Neisseriaceae bacterium]|nr:hypothetical protein [Neisseriaceae bacterium]MBQ9724375.1 hypothetical protein [Neisseriaceae bacterium]
MAFIRVTGTNGQAALINSNNVNKVIDFGSYRAIYQGSDTNHYQVKDTLANLQQLFNNSK